MKTTKIREQLRSLNAVSPDPAAFEQALAASRRRRPAVRWVLSGALTLSLALNGFLLLAGTNASAPDPGGMSAATERQDRPTAPTHSVTVYAAVPGDQNPELAWRIES